ncbi:Ig-like domain-containing protein [Pseudaeromonas sp. ZJS20]|uniref:Ig-like domain-containing protein n=1 Tax=Pseudaeromonas aegiceratis TaxID=3153928 RepID=UPI00390C9CA7
MNATPGSLLFRLHRPSILLASLLTACGGGDGTSIDDLVSDNAGSDSVTTSGYQLSLTLSTCEDLADVTTCTESSHLPVDQTSLVIATLTDAQGKAVVDAIISASTTEGTIQPTSSRLTDSAGQVRFLLSASPTQAQQTGTFTVSSTLDGDTMTASKNYEFGISNLQLSLSTDQTVLAPGSVAVLTASVSLDDEAYANPVQINFSSSCASNGRATLDSQVTTQQGLAIATYKGLTDTYACGGEDTIIASLAGTTALAQVTITNQTAAVRAITAATPQPELIYLRGTGKDEAATITFTLKDAQNKPVSGQQLDFSFGSLADSNANYQDYVLTPSQATTDLNGQASVTVNAGSIPVPLRVIATLHEDSDIRAASSQIGVGIGYPDDNSVSFAADRYNLDGACYDGREAQISIRLADRFNNPVPDGTNVYLTTEGGSVKGVLDDWSTLPDDTPGTCYAQDGLCRAVLVTQDPRPKDGRVTITAYVEGEESFWDYNGNGLFDKDDLVAVGVPNDTYSWEVPHYLRPYLDVDEVFMNYNLDDDEAANADEDGYRVNVDGFMDLNANGVRDAVGDEQYTGLLCTQDTIDRGFCRRDLVSLYRNAEFVFSGLTDCTAGHGDMALQMYDSQSQTWRSDITTDPGNGPIYIRILPVFVPQDGSANPIPDSLGDSDNFGDLTSAFIQTDVALEGLNPIPAGSKISISTDNSTSVYAATLSFGNCQQDYASAYPSTTRPMFMCFMLPSADDIEIRVTTPSAPHGQEDSIARSIKMLDNG